MILLMASWVDKLKNEEPVIRRVHQAESLIRSFYRNGLYLKTEARKHLEQAHKELMNWAWGRTKASSRMVTELWKNQSWRGNKMVLPHTMHADYGGSEMNGPLNLELA